MALDLSKLECVKITSTGWTARCPECARNGSGDKSGNHLAILRDGRFHCAVGGSSNSHSKAIWRLAGSGQSGEAEDSPDPVTQPIVVEQTWPLSVLDRLIQENAYWNDRGIPDRVLTPLRGGVATSAQMKGRWVFPIFDSRGEIHGFTGRAIDKNVEARWRHLGKVSNWVWGDLAGIKEFGRAILVEGVGCRLALDTEGVRGALPIWGLHISQAILGFLVSANPRDIVIALNNDVEKSKGPEAAERIKSVMDKLFGKGVARVLLPPAKDFLDKTMTQEKWDEWKLALDPPKIDESESEKVLTSDTSGGEWVG